MLFPARRLSRFPNRKWALSIPILRSPESNQGFIRQVIKALVTPLAGGRPGDGSLFTTASKTWLSQKLAYPQACIILRESNPLLLDNLIMLVFSSDSDSVSDSKQSLAIKILLRRAKSCHIAISSIAEVPTKGRAADLWFQIFLRGASTAYY